MYNYISKLHTWSTSEGDLELEIQINMCQVKTRAEEGPDEQSEFMQDHVTSYLWLHAVNTSSCHGSYKPHKLYTSFIQDKMF